MYDRTPSPMRPLAFFIFAEKYRCENGWSTTLRFISFPLRAFWSMIFWRKRPERKDEVHEFPVWNVHEAHGRSTAVGRNAPSRTQTIILQVIYFKNYTQDWTIGYTAHTQSFMDSAGNACRVNSSSLLAEGFGDRLSTRQRHLLRCCQIDVQRRRSLAEWSDAVLR